MISRLPLRVAGMAGLLLFSLAPAPVRGQCLLTEVNLYVEKSASASTRDEAREILGLVPGALAQALSPGTVNVVAFSGSISTSTVARFNVPPLAPIGPQNPIDAALDSTILNSPSATTIDLLEVFTRIQNDAAATAPPPLGPTRRFFFVIADFAHAPITDRWRREGPALLDQIRRTAVSNQNIHLIAIQAPPPGPLPADVHREVIGPIARNFLYFDQPDTSRAEIGRLLADASTPLGLQVSPPPPGAPVTQLLLQVSNPTCRILNPIVYQVVGPGIAPTVIAPAGCAANLLPGTGTGPCPIDLTVLQPLVPATGCINLWIEAVGTVEGVPGVAPRRGAAPQPITLGNCVEIDSAIHDLGRQVEQSADWEPYLVAPLPGNLAEEHATGILARGHIDAGQVELSWLRVGPAGQPDQILGTATLPRDRFNGLLFDGRVRPLLEALRLPRSVERSLCLSGREDEPTRLRLALTWGTGPADQAVVELTRSYPSLGEIPLHHPWETYLPILLLLLGASLLVANFLMPAELQRFSTVLLALTAGFLLLGFASHFGSRFGRMFEWGFAVWLEGASTVGLVLVWLVYLVLFLMGFFDRRPTAKECLEHVHEARLRDRRSRRRRQTVFALVVMLSIPVLLTLALVWFLPKELAECRFTYSAVQQP